MVEREFRRWYIYADPVRKIKKPRQRKMMELEIDFFKKTFIPNKKKECFLCYGCQQSVR